jgi:hypothetical protein
MPGAETIRNLFTGNARYRACADSVDEAHDKRRLVQEDDGEVQNRRKVFGSASTLD